MPNKYGIPDKEALQRIITFARENNRSNVWIVEAIGDIFTNSEEVLGEFSRISTKEAIRDFAKRYPGASPLETKWIARAPGFSETLSSPAKDIAATISEGDQAWLNFLEKQFGGTGKIEATKTLKSVSPITRGITKRHLLYGTGAILGGIWAFSEGDSNPLPNIDDIGLYKAQKRILRGEGFNSFDGMQHGGLAAEQRKIMTDFGSGYQGIAKAILKEYPVRIAKAGIGIAKGMIFDPERRLSGGVPLLVGAGIGLFDTSLGMQASLGATAGAELGYFSGQMKGGYKGLAVGALAGMGIDLVSDYIGGGVGSAFVTGIGISVASSIGMAALMKGGLGFRTQVKEVLTSIGHLEGNPAGFTEEVFGKFESLMGPRGLAFSFKKDVPEAFRKVKIFQERLKASRRGEKEFEIAFERVQKERSKLQREAMKKRGAKMSDFDKVDLDRDVDSIEYPRFEDFAPYVKTPLEEDLSVSSILATLIGLHPTLQKFEFVGRAAEKFPRLAHYIDAAVGSPALGNVAEKFGGLSNAPIGAKFKAIGKDVIEGIPIGLSFAGAGYLLSESEIPNKNDGFNSFDGMQHGGLAAEQRKIMTDFGSKYDSVRAMAKMMGKTFESFTKKKGWRRALESGEVVEKLGTGQFGEAHLMRSKYMGEEFYYVKKQLDKERGLRWLEKHGGGVKGREYTLEAKHEEEMMLPFGKGESIPSIYGVSKKSNTLYMEHMPGQSIQELASAGYDIPERARNILREEIRKVAGKGIRNIDIHEQNILYDPETKRISWIDFGLARPTTKKAGSYFEMMESFDLTFSSQVSQGKTIGERKTAATVNQKIQRSISRSREVQTAITKDEGMRHGGVAAFKRQMTTDFGSKYKGYKGIFGGVSRKVTKYLAKDVVPGAKKLLDPRKAAKISQGKTLEEFTKAIGEKGVIAREAEGEAIFSQWVKKQPGLAGGAAYGVTPTGKREIMMSPQRLRETFMQEATKAGMNPQIAERAVKSEDFLKTVLYHEVLEKQVAQRFATLRRMPAQHNASQVLVGEGGFLQHIGNQDVKQLFSTIRKARKEEYAGLTAGIEAFGEKGVSSSLRKLTTDFGSGYQGLRLAKSKIFSRSMAGSSRAQEKLYASSKDLRATQQQVWEWGRSGGKGHLKYGPQPVKQLYNTGGRD